MTSQGQARSKSGLVRARRGDLSRYDPDKGLKQIAVAEAAVRHFARAKDASNLQKAIRGKLQAQADFVHWWDHAVKKNKGGGSTRSRSATGAIVAGKNGIPDRFVIDRWRQKLGDDETFEATYQFALARYIRILELDPSVHVAQNSGENEWYTPADIIEAARTVLGGIDLDPASTAAANEVVKAATFFSAKDDGLTRQWHGRVWMNPPYAQPLIEDFAKKLAASIQAQDVSAAVALINNATETEWFNTMAAVAGAVCFPRGRIRFWSPAKDSATPLQGQALLYTGPNSEGFCEQFASFGIVARIVRAS